MEEEKLDIHISDIVENIDLKIYEKQEKDITNFIFHIEDFRDKSEHIFKMEEKIAAIVFEGLNHIFVEVDENKSMDTINEDTSANILDTFFKILKQNDIEHFGNE